jgi:hypothetical protein
MWIAVTKKPHSFDFPQHLWDDVNPDTVVRLLVYIAQRIVTTK